MANSLKRERQLARQRYLRQQARRRLAAQRRRRVQQGAAVAVALVAVIAGVVVLGKALGGNDSTVSAQPTASSSATGSSSPSASPSAAGCSYQQTGKASRKVTVPRFDPRAASRPGSATLVTNRGEITVELTAADAPCAVNSFRHLAQAGFYDRTPCHRLTTQNIFVLQCGDPTGTGTGGPGYRFPDENLPRDAENNYPAGTLAMANSGANTNGSQFFLVYKDTTLPPNFTIFGRITKGLDVVRKVADAGVTGGGGDGAPQQSVTIRQVRIGKA